MILMTFADYTYSCHVSRHILFKATNLPVTLRHWNRQNPECATCEEYEGSLSDIALDKLVVLHDNDRSRPVSRG